MGFSVKFGKLLRYAGKPDAAEVVIPARTKVIGKGAFQNCTSMQKLVLPEGLREIGDDAFRECTALTSVHIPGTVKRIGDRAFYDCKSLLSVTLPEGITKLEGQVFGGCENLLSVEFPDSLTEISYLVFRGCERLQSVTFPPHLTCIREHAFSGCGLTSVRFPDSVREIGYGAFAACENLTYVQIPETVERIGARAFSRTPWLLAQKEDFVIAGNHNLICYNGKETGHLHVPDSVRWIDSEIVKDLRKITYRGMTFEAAIGGKTNDLGIMLAMVMDGQYDTHRIGLLRQEMKDMYDGWGVPESTMYPVLWQLLPVFPEEPELLRYAREHLDELMQFIFKSGNLGVLQAVCDNGTFLNAENIDRFICLANDVGQHEMQIMLMDHKRKHIGYDEQQFRL